MTDRQQGRKTGGITSLAPFLKKKTKKKKISDELSERLVDALGLTANPESEQIKTLISQMSVNNKVKEVVYQKMVERYPEVKKNIRKLIAKSFDMTEEELLKLVEFLESDLGKKFKERQPGFNEALSGLLDEEATVVMSSVMGLIQEDLTKQTLDRGCDYKYYLPPLKDWRGERIKR